MAETRTTRYYDTTPETLTQPTQENTPAPTDTLPQIDPTNLNEQTEDITDTASSLPEPEALPEGSETERKEPQNASPTDTFFPADSFGSLVIRVQTARGTFPVSEAAVIVRRKENGVDSVVQNVFTNQSGETPEIRLPAPKKEDAQSPSSDLPFTDYDVEVTTPLYYTAIIRDVQIFGDEQTILVVDLIPLPEIVNETDITRTTTVPRQNL